MSSDSTRARELVQKGLHELRRGRIGAALCAWEEARSLDADSPAGGYYSYVKKNRIRFAVHLGRKPPSDDESIELPDNWPPPPAGLCDPPTLPHKETAAPAAAGAMSAPPPSAPPATTLPPADPPPPAAKPEDETAGIPEDSDGSGEYAVLEIVVEDDEEDEPSGALPPPPGAFDAKGIDLEAPREESREQEPQDYVVDRSDSQRLDSLGLERFAGSISGPDAGDAEPPPVPSPPSVPGAEAPKAIAPPAFAEDAPTIARDGEASPPKTLPVDDSRVALGGQGIVVAGVHLTLDEQGRPILSGLRPHQGASPKATMMGVGPKLDLSDEVPQGAASRPPPEKDAPPPEAKTAGEQRGTEDANAASFTEDGPTRARDASNGIQLDDAGGDFSSAEGSFSDDMPTRMRPGSAAAPGGGQAMIRPMPLDDAGDFTSNEASFSDDIPTMARPSVGTPPPRLIPPSSPETPRSPRPPGRRRPLNEDRSGPGDPGDYRGAEGSFSDDMPTRARDDSGVGRGGIRPMPLTGEFSREPSLSEDQVTLERKADREPSSNDEIEALLDPQRGLALARQLHTSGQFERSLELTEKLQERYARLEGVDLLLERNQQALESDFIDRLGPLTSVPVPKAQADALADMDLDPRAAFLFTRIDGTLSLEDLLDISGMSRFETARILVKLRDLQLLEFKPGPG